MPTKKKKKETKLYLPEFNSVFRDVGECVVVGIHQVGDLNVLLLLNIANMVNDYLLACLTM